MYVFCMCRVPVILRTEFGADMEGDDGWRGSCGIQRGGRGEGEGCGCRWGAIEEGLVSSLGKRHCGWICCCSAL